MLTSSTSFTPVIKGSDLKKIRKERGIRIDELSTFGLSSYTLSLIENSKSVTVNESIKKLLNHYSLDIRFDVREVNDSLMNIVNSLVELDKNKYIENCNKLRRHQLNMSFQTIINDIGLIFDCKYEVFTSNVANNYKKLNLTNEEKIFLKLLHIYSEMLQKKDVCFIDNLYELSLDDIRDDNILAFYFYVMCKKSYLNKDNYTFIKNYKLMIDCVNSKKYGILLSKVKMYKVKVLYSEKRYKELDKYLSSITADWLDRKTMESFYLYTALTKIKLGESKVALNIIKRRIYLDNLESVIYIYLNYDYNICSNPRSNKKNIELLNTLYKKDISYEELRDIMNNIKVLDRELRYCVLSKISKKISNENKPLLKLFVNLF